MWKWYKIITRLFSASNMPDMVLLEHGPSAQRTDEHEFFANCDLSRRVLLSENVL